MKVDYSQIITETPEDLKKQIAKAQKKVNFQKLQSLYLLKSGQVTTLTNLADCLGVHRVTLQKWLKKYKQGGLIKLLESREKTGRPTSLDSEAIASLEARLKEEEKGLKSYREIQEWLDLNNALKIHYKTLYHWVRYRLKAKLKVPRRKAVTQNPNEAIEFKKNCLSG